MERTSYGALAANLLLIAVIPAIGEELFFRGVLQKVFTDWFSNAHAGIIITSVLFSALHMQFFGFLPRFVLGVLFGYYFYWSRSLWLPIFAHFINNGAAVVVAFLAARGSVDVDYEEFGSYNQESALVGIYFLLSMLLIFFVFRQEQVRTKKSRQ
ncbi:MAG: CPBP family intramembrane glutamic endopeptidase [Bacteroidales bacterium]|nr:CPBP family intramembrane glutamic endopeptidase [Bacteroidales bacterium]